MNTYNPRCWERKLGELYIMNFFHLQRLLHGCMLQSYCLQFHSMLKWSHLLCRLPDTYEQHNTARSMVNKCLDIKPAFACPSTAICKTAQIGKINHLIQYTGLATDPSIWSGHCFIDRSSQLPSPSISRNSREWNGIRAGR